MRRIVTLAALVVLVAAVGSADNASRTFDATYTATITNIPADAGMLNVWIPLPTSRAGLQDVSDVKIDSSYAWQRMRESEFGDEYIFAKVPAPQTGELVVRVSFRATRRGIAFQNIGSVTPSKSEQYGHFLASGASIPCWTTRLRRVGGSFGTQSPASRL